MTSEALQRIQRFISGSDNSIEAANEIEVALDHAFPDDDYVQRTVEILALYRPEGGDFLFRASSVSQRLTETLEYVKTVT